MNYPHLEKAIDVIAKLRDPETGCPWDLKQNHRSLLKYFIEEVYEYIHAVEEEDYPKMEEELGDVLLQILLHSQIASENKHFDVDSVAKVLAEKMIYRHTHVLENQDKTISAEEVTANWKKLKNKKQNYTIQIEDAYAPALSASAKIGAKSQEINFDWDHIQDVMKKVEEELSEVKVEIAKDDQAKIYEEMGDLLFSVAQLSRHLGVDPEAALKDANLKFIKRINLVEAKVRQDGSEMKELPTTELENYWTKVKQELKSSQDS